MTERVGAWLTEEQLKRRNKELAKVGRRICRTHQGAALVLTEENFYRDKRKEGYFDGQCKRCHADRVRETTRKRYQNDKRFAEMRRQANRERHQHDRERRLEYFRRYYVRTVFARVLGVA